MIRHDHERVQRNFAPDIRRPEPFIPNNISQFIQLRFTMQHIPEQACPESRQWFFAVLDAHGYEICCGLRVIPSTQADGLSMVFSGIVFHRWKYGSGLKSGR
jgi:hypothetical protein